MVIITRLLLLVLLVGSVGAIGASLVDRDEIGLTALGLRVQNIDKGAYHEAVRIRAADFEGRDENNQPLDIKAADVLPQDREYRVVDLANATASLRTADGAPLDIQSREGTYDRIARTLSLRDDVVFRDELGLVVRTDAAEVNLDNKDISATKPVRGNAAQGSWSAEGMQIRNDGNLLILTGKSSVTINPGAAPTPRQTAVVPSTTATPTNRNQQ